MKKLTSGKDQPPASIAETYDMSAVEQCLATGDISKLSPEMRMQYLSALCASLHLNPLTRPFQFMELNKKLVVYATKDCADQIRARDKVSLEIVAREEAHGTYSVTVRATNPDGRKDEASGIVPMVYPERTREWQNGRWVYSDHPRAGQPFYGEDRANAIMKAESKAKRRVTLSISGLGLPDEDDARVTIEAQLTREEEEAARNQKPLTDEERKALDSVAGKLVEQASQEPDPVKAQKLHQQAIATERAAMPPEPPEHKKMMEEAKKLEDQSPFGEDPHANPPDPAPSLPVNEKPAKAREVEPTKIDWRSVVNHTGKAGGPVMGKTLGEIMDVPDINTVRGWHKYLMRHFDKIKADGKKPTIKDDKLKEAMDAGLAELEGRETAADSERAAALQGAEATPKGETALKEPAAAQEKPSEAEVALFGNELERSVLDSWRDAVCPASLGSTVLAGKRIGEMPPEYIFGIKKQILDENRITEASSDEEQAFGIAAALAYKAILGDLGKDGGRDELLKVVSAKLKLIGRTTVDTARQLFTQLIIMKVVQSNQPVRGFADLDPSKLRSVILRWDDIEQIHAALLKAQK